MRAIILVAALIGLVAIIAFVFWAGQRSGVARGIAQERRRRAGVDPNDHYDLVDWASAVVAPNSSIDPAKMVILPSHLRERGQHLIHRFL
jgi:hypothetical protein